jgi:hypothetical protein
MSRNRELHWIQANRTRPDHAQCVGGVLRGVVARAVDAGVEDARLVARMVAPVVDEEFCRHCRLLVAAGGGLVVNVDNPALVPWMRRRWLVSLREVLGRRGGSGSGRVVFAYGELGIALGEQVSADGRGPEVPESTPDT